MPDELALVAGLERVALDVVLGQANDAELEAPTQLDMRAGSARDFTTAAADVDNRRDFAGDTHAVCGSHVYQTRFFCPGDDTRANAGLLRHRIQKFTAVLRLARRARRRRDDLVDAMRFCQALEFRQ